MQPPASPTTGRRRTSLWMVLGAAALLLLGGLLLGARLLLASSTGMSLALRSAAALAGVEVRLQGPSGRLLDQFGFERVEIRLSGTRIVIRNLQARVGDWSLRPLQIAFQSIRASDVEVHAQAAQHGNVNPRPQRIAAPWPWQIGEVQIDALEYGSSVDATGAPLKFRSIRAGLQSDPSGYQLRAGHVETAEIELDAAATLGAQWPFPLEANGHLQSRLAQQPVRADWTGSGSLDQLDLSARLAGADVGGVLRAHLTSFAVPYLARIQANLQGVDPAHWQAGAPHALLDVRVDVRPIAQRASQLRGTFEAVNRASGTLDSERIPVRRLRGTLAADFDDSAGTTIRLSTVEAELESGNASGSVEIAARDGVERWSADGTLRRVDLSRLHSRVRPLRVDGSVHAENRAADRGAAFAAHGDLRAKEPVAAELSFDLQADSQRWSLSSAHLALNAGTFDAHGLYERATNHVQLSGAAHSLDAGLLVRTLRSRIDGRFDVDLALAPEPHGAGRFELIDSSVCWPANRCWPAQGHGVIELSADRQLRADVEVAVHGARAQARGTLAGSQGHLDLDVTAPELTEIDPTLHGSLQAHAVLSGAWHAPDVDLQARVQGLRALGQAAASISIALRGKVQRDAAFEVDASVETFGPEAGAAPWVQAASIQAHGTPREQTVSLQATLQGSRHLSVLARGGLAGKGWGGQLMQAKLDGAQAAQLSEPAPLTADASGLSFGPARLEALGASVQDALLQYHSGVLVTRGRFDGLRPPQAAPVAGVSIDSTGDPLKLRGHWDLTLGEHTAGQIAIERESGDLRPSLEAGAPAPLGLRELSAHAQIGGDQLQADFSMDSERAGHLSAKLRAAMQHGGDRNWWLDRRQPWHVEIAGQLPAVEALESFLAPQVRGNLRVGGRLALSLQIEGTPEQPRASGSIEGDQLRLAWLDQGIRLQDGRLRARVDGDRALIEELRFEGPLRVAPADRRARDALHGNPVGTVSASGEVALSDLAGSLQVQAHQLPVLQRSDRWLLVSGNGKVELTAHRIRLNASLAADAGFLDLSRSDVPTLSDDVHVIQPTRPTAGPTPGISVGTDLSIDLGSAFYLKGSGLDARISGPLRLQGEGQGALRVNGALSIEQGTYDGFGQHLSIRYGRVNFQGAPDNPGLDVLAVRTDLPVEVGVTVTGTVTKPVVRLHSDPPLPDYETLSWLALGRPPSDPRTDNVALARLAAGLLSGSGEGVPTRLARMIGIDEINLRSADVPASGTLLPRQSVAGKLTTDDTLAAATAATQIISLGHRINDAITVSYEQTVTGASNVVQVSYQLSRRLSLIGRAGSDNALNLVFSLPFD